MSTAVIATSLDVILALVLVEGLALAVFYRRTGRGVPPRALAGNLAAGFFLMLAARIALAPAISPLFLAASLLAALFAHLVDLWCRWR